MNFNNFGDSLIGEWIIKIKQESNAEWLGNTRYPKCILEKNIRTMIWSACSSLNVNSFGVPGYVCRMIEHYVEEKIQILATTQNNSWNSFKIYLSGNFAMIMAGAIIIASQLHHIQPTNPTAVTELLSEIGLADLSEENIFNIVNEIMSVNDYHFHMWTTTGISELLAHIVGLPATLLSFLRALVNKAEFHSWQINRDMNVIFSPNGLGNSRVLSIHLAAGSVYATAKFFYYNTNILPQLTTLVHVHEFYLTTLADKILHYSQNQDVN